MVERVVEIERMRHAGVKQRGLGRRQPKPPQHHLALLRAAPAAHDAREFRDAGLAAAAKQAAECVKDVVAGGSPRGSWQIREAAATDMLRQCPGRVLVHSQTFRILLLSRTSEHPNDGPTLIHSTWMETVTWQPGCDIRRSRS